MHILCKDCMRDKMSSEDKILVKSCNILENYIGIVAKFPTKSDKFIYAIIAGISAILTCTAIYLNACTVITIWKTSILREKLSNFTIMMQSAVDLLHGLLVMPLFTYLMFSEVTETASCLATYYVCKKLTTLIFLFSITVFSALNHSLVPRPNRYRCVGIAWKTQSETRGRAWQKMQKKVYDSTKK